MWPEKKFFLEASKEVVVMMMYDECGVEESVDEECQKKSDESLLPSRKGIIRHSAQQINRLK